MKKTKDTIFNIILVFILFAGLSLLLYPTFSDYWNSFRQTVAITGQTDAIKGMDPEELERLMNEARQYNQSMLERYNLFAQSVEEKMQYDTLLNVANDGIMGYVEIPKINCYLPVYHGVEESVLQVAIGHLDWSSLPVGGESTHCVISGHRGLPSARLFTDLDEMELGDRFYLNILGEKLAYEVDQILVVLPDEAEELLVKKGQDLVTMMTCTPYGINTHRLFVRGHRVEYVEPEPEEGTEPEENDDSVVITDNLSRRFWSMVIIVFSALIVLFAFLLFVFGGKKSKKKIEKEKKREGKKKDEEEHII